MTDGIGANGILNGGSGTNGAATNDKQPAEKKLTDLESALSLAQEEVDRALYSSPTVVRNYTKHLAGAKGKFIRAVSLLTCAADRDGFVDVNAVKLAAAVEVLHLATLVHDDVIDDADMRRGQPSLQKMFGKRTAVICGDYLLSVALRIAASVENKKDYIDKGYLDLKVPDYVGRICTGELRQHINNGNFRLSVLQYLKIISGKTAALFEASFYAGAQLSGCRQEEINAYKKMGHCLGMIFQLTDDCMDFEADESVAKKPVQSDFEKNVVTLPMIKAFHDDAQLLQKAQSNELTRDELNKAVIRTEGLAFTRMLAKKYYNKYLKLLGRLDISENKSKRLKEILNKAFREFN